MAKIDPNLEVNKTQNKSEDSSEYNLYQIEDFSKVSEIKIKKERSRAMKIFCIVYRIIKVIIDLILW
ncbi:MAG: hypothetical protein MJ252_24380 [archaeon]|nr:hypothetical protein [archaeon]